MKRNKIIILSTVILFTSGMLSVFIHSLNVKEKVKESLKLNKTLQEEGYYMGDFEFKMVACTYYLDKGHYRKAWKFLNDYHKKLSTREGLVKMPEFNSNQEEINFFLNLQNPQTGAFIDKSAPFCTYWSITENIIDHMEALEDSSTAPLKLKYPLSFLDEINTPEKLTAYLNDISYIGRLVSKFPQTSFHFARDILSEAIPGSTLERNGFYKFSPEWKHTMLKWMYDFQDEISGMWGPKNKTNKKLIKYDLHNTALILKWFKDNDGNDRYKEFPLKYQDKIFKSAIEQLSEPYPDDGNLAEIHEWNLRQNTGIKMLLRYLWKDASGENKEATKKLIERNIDVCFEKYYVETDGAFSYYPDAGHASPDGFTNLIFPHIGAYSYNKQVKLWGDPCKNVKDMGVVMVYEFKASDFSSLESFPGINSFRFYTSKPDFKHLTDSVKAIVYPNDTRIPDIMELVPDIKNWLNTSSLSMGNWSSMAEKEKEYSKLNIEKPSIFKAKFPYDEVCRELKESGELFIVGFDKLQLPIAQIEFKYIK